MHCMQAMLHLKKSFERFVRTTVADVHKSDIDSIITFNTPIWQPHQSRFSRFSRCRPIGAMSTDKYSMRSALNFAGW